jgi:hypothetical protein
VTLAAEPGDYLQSCPTSEEAYAVLSRQVPRLLPGVAGAVSVTSHSRTLVETFLTWGDRDSFATTFHPEECWGLWRGRSHHVAGEADPECGHLTTPAGSLCLPMLVHGEALGVLSLATDPAVGLGERGRHAAGLVAERVALTLANLRLQEALRDNSLRDPLTRLCNRRTVEAGRSLERRRESRGARTWAT